MSLRLTRMNCHGLCLLLFLWFFCLGPIDAVSSGQNNDPIISTKQGRIRGIQYHLQNTTSVVDAFLGIPFAKAPVGYLRFRHPQPIEPWNGIYNATKLPNSCYQTADEFFGNFRGSSMWNPNTRVSEDCLYLNVWVPKTNPRLRKSAVMVWIYGGGFFGGTTTLDLYDGKILAAENNIIVVSIGYRVGALGFLTLHHPSAPGNAGLFDQLMALEWVQKNIHNFGGDPDSVTLFGWDAGSVSVTLHLLSPLSSSKFERAIMQSGTANMQWGTMTLNEGKRRSLELAYDHFNCPQVEDMDDVVKCLQAISPQELVNGQWISRGIMQFPFLPVIDGTFLLESPMTSLRRKSFKKCPVLMGSNLNEGTYFLIYELYDYLTLTKSTMTREQFLASINILFDYYPQYPERMNSFGSEAISYLYSNVGNQEDQVANIKALDNAVGDEYFTCNVNEFGQVYANYGEDVYMYYFTERYSSNPWPQWMGVLHGDEIIFTFGDPLKPGSNYTDKERDLSKRIMTYWTNFAKTGDPNLAPGSQSLREWPLFTPTGKEYLELNSKYLHQPDKSRAVGQGLRAKECAFWKDYLPELVRKTTSS